MINTLYQPQLSPRRIWIARAVAITADALQIAIFPLFIGGALEGFDDVLDFIVAGLMIALLGWHWAFLPSFLAELVPGLDLVPSWALAVFMVTREKRPAAAFLPQLQVQRVPPVAGTD